MEQAEPGGPRYSAFISYARSDRAFAQKLHRGLEGYRFPRRVRARRGPWRGPGSRRLREIFLDRASLTAAPELSAALRAAIAQSGWLIVVCSPDAARSGWVGREIAEFRAVHGDDCILAALIAGTPAESFPPALRIAGADGAMREPLAADFRKGGDGSRLALLKLLAQLAGVGLDDLVQRDTQRRVRSLTAVVGLSAAGMALTSALALIAIDARDRARREQASGATLVEFLIKDLRARLQAAGRLDIREAVNRGAIAYFRDQATVALPLKTLELRAELLTDIGADDLAANDFAHARAAFDDAQLLSSALVARHRGDTDCLYAYAQAEAWEGITDLMLKDYERAEPYFRAYAALAARLIAIAPGRAEYQMEVGYANVNLGTLELRWKRDLPASGEYFARARAAFAKAVGDDPASHQGRLQLADADGWIGDTERLGQHYARARAARRDADALLQQMAHEDPNDAEVQAKIVANDLALARIDAAEGAFGAALRWLDTGQASAAELARRDASNRDYAGELRIFHLFRARTWLMMPQAARAGASIGAELGNCAADRAVPNNDEIYLFCSLLSARLLVQQGRARDAAMLIDAIMPLLRQQGDMLSPGWGLDFREELAQAARGGAEQETLK